MYESLMLLLVLLSTFGFVNLLRPRLRLPFMVLFPFVQACQTVVMMVAGFCHAIHFSAWMLLLVGDLAWIWQLAVPFKSKDWHLRGCLTRLSRVEHLVVMGLCLLVFAFFVFNVFWEWSPDLMYCWYNHYYYLLSKGKWPGADYTNYAHSYCMIGNAYASFLGCVLRDTGMSLYSYSMLLLSIGASLPLLVYTKWKSIQLETLIGIVALFLGRLYAGWLLWLIPALLVVCLVRKAHQVSRGELLRIFSANFMLLLTVGILFMLNAYSYWIEMSYPLDSLLGIYALGVLSIFAYGCHSPSHWWRLIPVEAVMLMVMTHIKPTGIIPAVFLVLLISAGSAVHLIRTHGAAFDKIAGIRLLTIALLLSVPFIMFFSWQGYCSRMGWEFHEGVDKDRLMRHLQSGIPRGELEAWRSKFIPGSGLMPTSLTDVPDKGLLMSLAERGLGRLLHNVKLDPEEKFQKVCLLHRQNAFHHAACMIALVVICALLIIGLRSRRRCSFAMFLALILFYLLVCVDQYFIVPMYTKIPALFRYVYYGFTLPFGLFAFLCWRFVIARQYAYVCIVWVLFVWCFKGPLFQRIRTGLNEWERYSPVCASILMNSGKAGGCRMINSCQTDLRMAAFLNDSGIVKSNHRISWGKLRPGEACIMFYNGIMNLGKDGRTVKGEFGQRGFYYAPATRGKALWFKKLYCDEDALDLVSKAYGESYHDWLQLINRTPVRVFPCEGAEDVPGLFRMSGGCGRSTEDLRLRSEGGRIALPNPVADVVKITLAKSFYCFQDDIVYLKWTLRGVGLSDDGATAILKGMKGDKVVAIMTADSSARVRGDEVLYEQRFSLAGNGQGPFDRYQVEISVNDSGARELYDIMISQSVSGTLDFDGMIREAASRK